MQIQENDMQQTHPPFMTFVNQQYDQSSTAKEKFKQKNSKSMDPVQSNIHFIHLKNNAEIANNPGPYGHQQVLQRPPESQSTNTLIGGGDISSPANNQTQEETHVETPL